MQKIYSRTFVLSAGETNAQQELAFPLLVAQIIDMATLHATQQGIGNSVMEHLNCGWVLSRITVEADRYPEVNKPYTIKTWIEDSNRHFSTRSYAVVDDEGNTIVYARSIWMVINTITHESVGLQHLGINAEMTDGTVPPIAPQRKHLRIAPFGTEASRGEIAATHPEGSYTFRYCDIDFYRHVNTVRYIMLLLNQFTLEDFDRNFIRRFEIAFMHEARYGMTVGVRRAEVPTDEPGQTDTRFALHAPESAAPLIAARIVLAGRTQSWHPEGGVGAEE